MTNNLGSEFNEGSKWFAIRDPRKYMVVEGSITLRGETHIIFETDAEKTHMRTPSEVRRGWKPMPQFELGDEIILSSTTNSFYYMNDNVVLRFAANSGIALPPITLVSAVRRFGPIMGKGVSVAPLLAMAKRFI